MIAVAHFRTSNEPDHGPLGKEWGYGLSKNDQKACPNGVLAPADGNHDLHAPPARRVLGLNLQGHPWTADSDDLAVLYSAPVSERLEEDQIVCHVPHESEMDGDLGYRA
jgi:hypothetical protein